MRQSDKAAKWKSFCNGCEHLLRANRQKRKKRKRKKGKKRGCFGLTHDFAALKFTKPWTWRLLGPVGYSNLQWTTNKWLMINDMNTEQCLSHNFREFSGRKHDRFKFIFISIQYHSIPQGWYCINQSVNSAGDLLLWISYLGRCTFLHLLWNYRTLWWSLLCSPGLDQSNIHLRERQRQRDRV